MEQPPVQQMDPSLNEQKVGVPSAMPAVDNRFKLFVGQIPKDVDDSALKTTFSTCGTVVDTHIVRDKQSGISNGCGFVTFSSKEEADRAIEQFHDKITYPGMKRPVQVKYANSEDREAKLFCANLPTSLDQEGIRNVFSKFGKINEIYIIRDQSGQSRGCCFVKFASKAGAESAILNMNDKVEIPPSTRKLVVRYADSKGDKFKRQQVNQQRVAASSAMPAPFQGLPLQLLMPQAPPMGANAAQQYAPAPQQMLPQQYSAFAALAQGASPQQLAALAPYFVQQPQQPMAQQLPSGGMPASGAAVQKPQPSRGPDGANLFIYHLPPYFTDPDLLSLFSPFGRVMSATVNRDLRTGESKGFGFVSYESAQCAQEALHAMNGLQVGDRRLQVQLKQPRARPY